MSAGSNSSNAPFSSEPNASFTSAESDVYRAVSRAAVASIVLSVFGLAAFATPFLLLLPLLGVVFAFLAFASIKKYPDEIIGRPIAVVGLSLGVLVMVLAPAYHGYVYATEVPEGYTRVSFSSLMSGKNQPDAPPVEAMEWDGKPIFIKGYVHPTSMDTQMSKKFVLVPDLGTCCFGGQPPLTHMIEVTLTGEQYAYKNTLKKRLAGTLSVDPRLKPVDGLTGVYYQLRADILK